MCDLWSLLYSSKRFSTRWFYSGGGSSAGASSWKVHNLYPRPPHGCDVTLEIKIIYVCTFKCIHRTMFVVPCICTQCVFHGNEYNFNAGIYAIMTILNTNLGLSQISPQRVYQFGCVLFMINSFITFNSPTFAHLSVYSTYLSSMYFYLQNLYLL